MPHFNTIIAILMLVFGLTVSGCSSSSGSQTSKSAEVVTLNIPSYDQSALIVVNTRSSTAEKSDNIGSISFPEISSFITAGSKSSDLRSSFRCGTCMDVDLSVQKPVTKHNALKIASGTTFQGQSNYTFTVTDISGVTSLASSISSTLVYSGTTVLIYQQTSTISSSTVDWSAMGALFEAYLAELIGVYGQLEDVNEDNKLTVLLYDFPNGIGSGTTIGYFYPADLFGQSSLNPVTNEMDIVYLNTQVSSLSLLKHVFVHEVSHLLTFSERYFDRGYSTLETWLSEALAEDATYYILDDPLQYHFDALAESPIRNGLSLTYWQYEPDNYALAYTFLEYARIHSDQTHANFIRGILENSAVGYAQIQKVLKEANVLFSDMADIWQWYRIANLVGSTDEESVLGYGSFPVTLPTLVEPNTTVTKLYPGGAIVLYPSSDQLNTFSPDSSAGQNIRFIKINPE